jgi:hypothetical protein
MKNNGLVPTPIVNKNGVQTTVHKRIDAPSLAVVKIPSPAHAATPQNEASIHEETVQKIIDWIMDYMEFTDDPDDQNELADMRKVFQRRTNELNTMVLDALPTI